MTTDEAQSIHDAYSRQKGKGTPAEFMRYMAAKQVLADAGRIGLTPGQRGFLQAVRRAINSGEEA